MIRFISRWLASWLMVLVLCLLGTPAFAHAQLLSSQPGANALLAHAPDRLELVFNEPVTPLTLHLLTPTGEAIDLLAAAEAGETLRVPLPATVGEGTHVLSWRVVSVDAHPIAGSLIFSIGLVTGSGAAALETAPVATTVLLWLSKFTLFAALFFGIGGAVFVLVAPLPPGVRSLVQGASLLALLMAPLSAGLNGADALGLAPDALLSGAVWQTGFSTTYGLTAGLLATSALSALLALYLHRGLAWLCLLLPAMALSLSGHAGAAAPQWLTRPAVAIHIAGLLFWVGALVPLGVSLRQANAAADRALAQFSRLVPWAVGGIVLSGLVLAMVQLGPPGPSWLSPYGFVLAAKLGLLLVLFGLALWNRVKLTRPVLDGDAGARRHLRQSILVEIVLLLAILGLVAAWRFTPPPRALAAAEAAAIAQEDAHVHVMTDALMVDLTVSPGQVGPVSIEIFIVDIEGNPVEPISVELTLSSPALGIEPFKVPAVFRDGIWHVDGQVMPLAGLWSLALDIRRDRFTLTRLTSEITILN